jgi:hypothetical protein
MARGRRHFSVERSKEGGEGYQVREEPAPYNALFGAEKDDIGPKNTFFWDIKTE